MNHRFVLSFLLIFSVAIQPALSQIKANLPVATKTNDENKDSDGDGIADKIDKCPNKAGPLSNSGCPMANKPVITSEGYSQLAKAAATAKLIAELSKGTPSMKNILQYINQGADVNTKDKKGFTALMWAAAINATDTTRILLDRGADVNAKDKDGWTALNWAASFNATETARLLIVKRSDVNAKDKDGGTALMMAASENSIETARLLIDKGADVNAKSNTGYTALMKATTDEMKALLRSYGAQ